MQRQKRREVIKIPDGALKEHVVITLGEGVGVEISSQTESFHVVVKTASGLANKISNRMKGSTNRFAEGNSVR